MFGKAKIVWNHRYLAKLSSQSIQQPYLLRHVLWKNAPRLSLQNQQCCFCAATFSNEAPKRRLITYLTDIEGDAAYLDRYVEQSKVLTFRKIEPRLEETKEYFPYSRCIDFVHNDAVLVFGGDIWDKGGSDLYVIRQLLDLRQRYGPDRVFFIMGNRDVNKMRMIQELGLEGQESLPIHGGIYFLRGTGIKGDPVFFEESTRDPSMMVPQTSAVERLQWMLSKSMGSPNAFELRKKELESERRACGETDSTVSDEDVVQSYRQSCHPSKGEMGRYLSKANLALRLGNILFLHGALPLTHEVLTNARRQDGSPPSVDDSTFFWSNFDFAMPWTETAEDSADAVDNPNDWFKSLNEFAQINIDAWKQNIFQMEHEPKKQETQEQEHVSEVWMTLGGYHQWTTGKSYGALMQYGMGWTPDMNRNPTVVYSSWLTSGTPSRFCPNNATPEDITFARLTRQFFNVASLELIVSGHQPHGDLPVAIRVDNDNKSPSWILCCDTSYSGDTLWINDEKSRKERSNIGRGRNTSGRGDVAVCEVLIEQCASSGNVVGIHCHGTLSDGSKYETINFLEDHVPVGQFAETPLTPDVNGDDKPRDYWIKAKFTNGSYLITTGEGYNVWNYVVDAES